jgi:hypothetical protein
MSAVATPLHQLRQLLSLIGRQDRCHLPQRVRAHLDALGHQPLDLVLLRLDRLVVVAGQCQMAKLGLRLPELLPVLALGVGIPLVHLTERLRLLIAEAELLLEPALPPRWLLGRRLRRLGRRGDSRDARRERERDGDDRTCPSHLGTPPCVGSLPLGRRAFRLCSGIALWYHPRAMPQRLPDLVGRAMVDPDFLADLQRTPDAILAQYDLSDDERGAIQAALVRLADTPAHQRAVVLRTTLLRRVAT